MIHIGWTPDQVKELTTGLCEDFEDDPDNYDDRCGMQAWLAASDDERSAIVLDAMKLLAQGIYQQPNMRPRLTMSVRHYLSMMGGWWPNGVGGAPITDHSMFGDGGEIACRCCGHKMGRQEEFRTIVYGMPTEKKTVYTKVPICWSCIKGGNT
jgi:hypothetical protein